MQDDILNELFPDCFHDYLLRKHDQILFMETGTGDNFRFKQ